MAWAPGPRAEWVREANRGERPELTPEPGPFDADVLLTDAERRHGGGDLRGTDIVEPLRIACRALEDTARLTPLGRWATQRYLHRLLDVRLALEDHRRADPTAESEPVTAPVFVVGAPRTGTTVMHRLLAADPAHRVPEGWEFTLPLPPPEPATHDTDPRIEAAAEELVFPQSVATGIRAIHTYSARMPKECLSAMAFSLRTEELISRYDVPDYAEWLHGTDMTPAYAIHRLVLQVLQQRMPARRWVLKSPVHLQSLPELVATYPDARFVVTHRDPVPVLGSVSSLVATLRSAFSDHVDPIAVGRYHLDLYGRSLDRLVDHVDQGLLPPDRTVHVRHVDLVDDPLAVVRRVYAGLDLRHSPAVDDAVDEELATAREDEAGAHRYDPADFGIDEAAAGRTFARYRRRFLDDR